MRRLFALSALALALTFTSATSVNTADKVAAEAPCVECTEDCLCLIELLGECAACLCI